LNMDTFRVSTAVDCRACWEGRESTQDSTGNIGKTNAGTDQCDVWQTGSMLHPESGQPIIIGTILEL
jgi:hypothetical protein